MRYLPDGPCGRASRLVTAPVPKTGERKPWAFNSPPFRQSTVAGPGTRRMGRTGAGNGRQRLARAHGRGYDWVWCSGSTPRLGRGGRWFDPSHPDQRLSHTVSATDDRASPIIAAYQRSHTSPPAFSPW